MSTNARHAAPWGATLRITTWAVAGLLAVVWCLIFQSPQAAGWPRRLGLAIPPVMIAVGALFTVRGYELRAGELRVARLLWTTSVSLAGLKSVEANPLASRGSLRLWGNGGFFSFSGWYANQRLGRYRMFATDPARSVVLSFAGRRPIVVTPEDPARFVGELTRLQVV